MSSFKMKQENLIIKFMWVSKKNYSQRYNRIYYFCFDVNQFISKTDVDCVFNIYSPGIN